MAESASLSDELPGSESVTKNKSDTDKLSQNVRFLTKFLKDTNADTMKLQHYSYGEKRRGRIWLMGEEEKAIKYVLNL